MNECNFTFKKYKLSFELGERAVILQNSISRAHGRLSSLVTRIIAISIF